MKKDKPSSGAAGTAVTTGRASRVKIKPMVLTARTWKHDARARQASRVLQGGGRVARDAGCNRYLSLIGGLAGLETAAYRPGYGHVRSEKA